MNLSQYEARVPVTWRLPRTGVDSRGTCPRMCWMASARDACHLGAPLEERSYADWECLVKILLDGAFPTARAALRQICKRGSGSTRHIGLVHSKEASMLNTPYVTVSDGLMNAAKSSQRDVPCTALAATPSDRVSCARRFSTSRLRRSLVHQGCPSQPLSRPHPQRGREWRVHDDTGRCHGSVGRTRLLKRTHTRGNHSLWATASAFKSGHSRDSWRGSSAP
jgi:hypothetical protein